MTTLKLSEMSVMATSLVTTALTEITVITTSRLMMTSAKTNSVLIAARVIDNLTAHSNNGDDNSNTNQGGRRAREGWEQGKVGCNAKRKSKEKSWI